MSIPNCAGRFPPLCSTSLPEVTNYDYETNPSTRGIEDRNFRWQEVFVEANWLFLEATASGQLEYSPLSATLTGQSGQLTITYPTTSYTGFSGWILTGGYTTLVGYSGSYFYSGNLTGYTGQGFWANPIEGNQSVGLWCNSSNIPKIQSHDLLNNPSGVQNNQSHQVYLQAYANKYTGATPRLKAYVQAFTGSTTLGYYDPISKHWSLTLPTGSFSVSTSTYTEIKYTFSPASLPFANPTSYKLVVENIVTGSFVTVDDLHVDQYLEKDPFMDYIIPTGYMIQISPDLGWHNPVALFESNSQGLQNPYIKTLGPYLVDYGNLADNLDTSVTATIDSGDFASSVVSSYGKYLWRAIPISPNGDIGKGGMPEKFEYIGSRIEKEFEVLEVREDPASPIKIITGKRTNRIRVLVNSIENHPALEYPSDNTWKLSYYVGGAKEVIYLQGKDKGGALTTKRYIELSNESHELASQAVWNVFDEHGLLLDLKRLPGESNISYKKRLMDVTKNRGGASYQGLKKIEDGIVLSMPKNSTNTSLNKILSVEFGSASFNIRTPEMIISETVYVDPVYGTASLSKKIIENPVFAVTTDGIQVPLTSCSVYIDEDHPSLSQIFVDHDTACGKYITVTYKYSEQLTYKDYPTLAELVTAIDGLTDHAGNKLVDVTLSMQLSGNEDCLGLFIISGGVTGTNSLSVAWTPIKLRRISDKAFREYFETEDHTFRETRFQEYVSELISNSRTLWGNIEADRDYWDAVDSTVDSFDYLPTVFDPDIARFYLSGENQYIDSIRAWGRSFVGDNKEIMFNNGLEHTLFHPGVAHTNDLMPDIHATYLKSIDPTAQRTNISVEMNDNNIVLFSGQR